MSGNGASGLSGLSADELRAEVRAVLRELLPGMVGQARQLAEDAGQQPEDVAMRTDADLDAFARRVAALLARCEDPAQREAIRAGRVRFTLGAAAPA